MAYDEEDGDVLDIDAAAGLDTEDEEDEMDGFHEVDPTTGGAVVADVADDDEDEDDDLDEEVTEVNL